MVSQTNAQGVLSCPPDGIDPAVWDALDERVRSRWSDLSRDDRASLLYSARGRAAVGLDYHESRSAVLTGDPATNAALDALSSEPVRLPPPSGAGERLQLLLTRSTDRPRDYSRADVTGFRIREGTESRDTESVCQNNYARTATRVGPDGYETEVIELDCGLWACPACGPELANDWTTDLHANIAEFRHVHVADIAKADEQGFRKGFERVRKQAFPDAIYQRIPIPGNRVMIVATAPIAEGRRVKRSRALRDAEAALRTMCTTRKIDRRNVSTGGSFVKAATKRRVSEPDPNVIYGRMSTNVLRGLSMDLATALQRLVDQVDGVELVTVLGPTPDTNRYKLTGPALAMETLLAKAGHLTDEQLRTFQAMQRTWNREERESHERHRDYLDHRRTKRLIESRAAGIAAPDAAADLRSQRAEETRVRAAATRATAEAARDALEAKVTL